MRMTSSIAARQTTGLCAGAGGCAPASHAMITIMMIMTRTAGRWRTS